MARTRKEKKTQSGGGVGDLAGDFVSTPGAGASGFVVQHVGSDLSHQVQLDGRIAAIGTPNALPANTLVGGGKKRNAKKGGYVLADAIVPAILLASSLSIKKPSSSTRKNRKSRRFSRRLNRRFSRKN